MDPQIVFMTLLLKTFLRHFESTITHFTGFIEGVEERRMLVTDSAVRSILCSACSMQNLGQLSSTTSKASSKVCLRILPFFLGTAR